MAIPGGVAESACTATVSGHSPTAASLPNQTWSGFHSSVVHCLRWLMQGRGRTGTLEVRHAFNTRSLCVPRGERQPEQAIKLWLRLAVALTAFIVTFLILYSFVASLDVPVIRRHVGLSGGPATVFAAKAASTPREVRKLREITTRGTDPLENKKAL